MEESKEEVKEEATKDFKMDILRSDIPSWVSLSKRRRENKELAKKMGMERYQGGGFMVDTRW